MQFIWKKQRIYISRRGQHKDTPSLSFPITFFSFLIFFMMIMTHSNENQPNIMRGNRTCYSIGIDQVNASKSIYFLTLQFLSFSPFLMKSLLTELFRCKNILGGVSQSNSHKLSSPWPTTTPMGSTHGEVHGNGV